MATEKYQTLIPLFDELQGERVLVRPYQESDAQSLFEAVAESREHLRPWLPFADAHQTIEETKDWIIQGQAKWQLREYLFVGIFDQVTGHYVGGSSLHPRNWDGGHFEIGYWLRASAEGHGYMTEAVKLLTDFAFTHLQANRVQIRCDVRNERSAAVARRSGYVQEGLLRNLERTSQDEFRSMLLFSMIPEDRQTLS